MLMRDLPLIADLAEAKGRAQPHIDLFAIGFGAAHPVETMAEGHSITRRDFKVADLIPERPIPRREPFFHALLAGVY